MRVVQIANFYGPRSGGLRTAVDELGAGYVRLGHEVSLIVPGPATRDELLASGVRRRTIPARKIPFTGGYRAARSGPVIDLLEELAPDVIEVSDRLTLRGLGAWAGRRGVSSVMISHERLDRLLGQVLPVAAARRMADVANRASVRSYDVVVCTTQFAREEFDRLDVGNVRQVALGVDLDLFNPSRFSAELRDDFLDRPQQLLIVHCGRLSVEKHVERGIDAVAALCVRGYDARLVIAGDGPRRAHLERRAAGLPVDFLGHVGDRTFIARLLASADVALAPGPHETFGLAALESLASGTPIVVSESSALAALVTGRCGIAAPDTAVGFADAIARVLDLPSHDRGKSARERAEQFGWPSAVEGMLDTFPRSGPTYDAA